MRPSLLADLALLLITFIWGATFVTVQGALADASPFVFLVLRFGLAAVLCLPWLARRGAWRRDEIVAGATLGALVAAGFALQTHGLTLLTPSRSAFITSLYVVLTPLLALPLRRHRPSPATLGGVGCALAGLALMTWSGGGFAPRLGDWLTLACAVVFAVQILAIDAFTARYDDRRLVALQIGFAALLLLPCLVLERIRLQPSGRLWLAVAITAGPATAVAFGVQGRLQRRTTPNRAALLFASEPVFTALTARLVRGDSGLGARGWAGATLILAGVLLAELRFSRGGGPEVSVAGRASPPGP